MFNIQISFGSCLYCNSVKCIIIFIEFQPGESLPIEETSLNDYVAILKTQYGGHIGFMEGWAPTRYHFSDRVFSQFANAVFSNIEFLNAI